MDLELIFFRFTGLPPNQGDQGIFYSVREYQEKEIFEKLGKIREFVPILHKKAIMFHLLL